VAEGVPVVSNTTPLITLAGVGLLELLPNLYGSVTVAESVIAEYEAKARTDDLGLRSAAWLTIVAISVPDDLAAILDAGEAATIALAQQLKPRLVLLDERRGRRVARERGLPIIGTGAVLVEAKRQGLLPAVAPVLDAMVAQGRYISEQLRLTLLGAAGEQG
jgi:predicted nucleic acid-binding protein